MMKTTVKQKSFYILLCTIMGTIAILSGVFLNPINHYINALLLVFFAVALYFLIVIFIADKNWLDLRAVFSGVWLGTIGIAALRLTAYQEVWQKKTWVLLSIAYFVFQIGATIGIGCGDKVFAAIKNNTSKMKTGRVYFSLRENRLFAVALVMSLIGLGCFIIGVAIKGFIPCFSNDQFAYINFYTRFHVFSVAATMSSGLCYYCIKTQSIGRIKKIILWLCIFYHVILFPIMIVSRGVFVTAALTFTAVVFYLNKKRFIAVILCLVAIMGIYMLTSTLRNYTDDQLSTLFQPVEIIFPDEDKENDDKANDNDVDNKNDTSEPTFALSPKMSFLYGYLTVGHDNFNEAVENLDDYTWGTRSLAPFNVILRSESFTNTSASVDYYLVRPYLNTNNILGTFYYDFHEYGIVLFMFILSFVFGALQICYEKFKGPFLLLAMSNTVQIGALSFFENLTARLEFWMFWGVVLIFAGVSCINIKSKKDRIE